MAIVLPDKNLSSVSRYAGFQLRGRDLRARRPVTSTSAGNVCPFGHFSDVGNELLAGPDQSRDMIATEP
ncbi:hypothetical protein ACFVYA_45625 [Amycolatopsis sp. NPDC058278]|uniref:hypothetical protein n=1 Tax=Amycolatopsis sp. NPDC058278 TaxID=3346417 RepID=UPI0036D880A0